jgi:hypothetical protein
VLADPGVEGLEVGDNFNDNKKSKIILLTDPFLFFNIILTILTVKRRRKREVKPLPNVSK